MAIVHDQDTDDEGGYKVRSIIGQRREKTCCNRQSKQKNRGNRHRRNMAHWLIEMRRSPVYQAKF